MPDRELTNEKLMKFVTKSDFSFDKTSKALKIIPSKPLQAKIDGLAQIVIQLRRDIENVKRTLKIVH